MYPSTSMVRESLTRKVTEEQKLEGHERANYRFGKAVQTATAMAAAQTKAHAWGTGEGARWPSGRATELKNVGSSYSSSSALGKGIYRWLQDWGGG